MVCVRKDQGPVLLGEYAAKQYPVRTQIDWHPLVGKVEREPTAEEQAPGSAPDRR